MTTVEALQNLKKFIESEVASSITLLKEKLDYETQEADYTPEYVNPYVALITLPHKNFIPTTFRAPNILIGLDMGDENHNEHAVSIRIVFTVYGGETPLGVENLPDETGYIDLLNLIERTKSKLTQAAVIERAGLVEKDFQYGIYSEEITYPYWYGFLQFKMQLPIDQRQMLEDYL